MDAYTFEDVLTGATVGCGYPYLQSHDVDFGEGAKQCESVVFPGCSFINYGLPLVQAVYDTLKSADCVQGISLLCCGKILSYEPNGDVVRPRFEEQLREHLLAAGTKRIVAACPNCVTALRNACAADERTASIEIVALPAQLSALGYRIDPEAAASLVASEVPEGAQAVFCPHDSCPDRKTGEFAQGMRGLMENLNVVEAAHNRTKSICCGSLARAAGKPDAADKCANLCGSESLDAGASVMVTPCVSCSFQLTMAQSKLPVFHYLELLYNWRIDWAHADMYMKLRFLFDDIPNHSESRAFVPLSSSEESAE